jgi:hypothetical protein
VRCYFIKASHIFSFVELPGLSDDEAVAQARILFFEHSAKPDGYEVWDRVIIRHPDPMCLSTRPT